MKQRRVAACVGVILFTLVGIVTSNHCSNPDGNITCACMALAESMCIITQLIGFVCCFILYSCNHLHALEYVPIAISGELTICIQDEGIQQKIVLFYSRQAIIISTQENSIENSSMFACSRPSDPSVSEVSTFFSVQPFWYIELFFLHHFLEICLAFQLHLLALEL